MNEREEEAWIYDLGLPHTLCLTPQYNWSVGSYLFSIKSIIQTSE